MLNRAPARSRRAAGKKVAEPVATTGGSKAAALQAAPIVLSSTAPIVSVAVMLERVRDMRERAALVAELAGAADVATKIRGLE